MAEVKQETAAHIEEITSPSDSTIMVNGQLLWRLILCCLRQADMIKNTFGELGLKVSKTQDDKYPFQFQMNSLEKLKDACDKGKMLDFLHCVFVSTGAANKLGIGSFGWKLIMYLKPHGKSAQESGKLKIKKKEQKKLWKLFKEELGPKKLFETLKSMDIFGERDRVPYDGRAKKMEFLLKRLLRLKGTDEWFKILQNYCRTNGKTFVLKKIREILGKRAEDESQPGKEIFTTAFRLINHRKSVRCCRKKGYTNPVNENQVPGLAVDISIQDSKWHLPPVEKPRRKRKGTISNDEAADGEESFAHIDKDGEHDIAILLQPDMDTAKEKTARRENPCRKRKGTMCNDVALGKRHRGSPAKHYLRSSRTRQSTRRVDDGHLLSSRGLSDVANRLGSEWKSVMRHLGLKEEEIERILMDRPQNTLDQTNKALTVWSNQSSRSADEKVLQLLDAIKEAGRNDIFCHLKEKYNV